MRDLIFDGGPIQAAFQAGNDATVLTLLNTATGRVTVNALVDVDVIVEAESESFCGDFIRSLNAQITALNASAAEEDKRLAAILQVYSTQLAGDGIDLVRDKVRNKVSDALQAQGWNNAKRNRILSLGYVLKSKPQVRYGRDATQSDLDTLRADLVREQLEQEYLSGLNSGVNEALANGDRAGLIAALQALAAALGV